MPSAAVVIGALRVNRSVLAVICWVINHCLEVSCKVDQIVEGEWFIFSQLSNKLWFITQQITHESWSTSILTHIKWQKSNYILLIRPTFCHRIKKSCQQFDCNVMFTCISYAVDARKMIFHHLTSWKRQQSVKMTSEQCQIVSHTSVHWFVAE